MAATTAQSRCLLCSSAEIAVQDELTGRELIALWRVLGRSFTAAALSPMTQSTRVPLLRCCSCGFRFYDTSLAGSGLFYDELMAGGYYVETRPEFEFALEFIRASRLGSVLDIGSGDGGFLDLARQHGVKTFGVELSPAAATRAAAKGHCMISKLLADVSLDEVGGGVDMVTLHQVVEHVPDPVGFVRDSARLVKPGGYLTIAVPNEYRLCGLLPYDPANWPPHHVSRWRKRDLRELAARAGLTVVSDGCDILLGSSFESCIPMHNRLAVAIGRRRYWLNEKGARLLSLFYRKLGLKYFFPRLGLSIYIVAQKPVSSAP